MKKIFTLLALVAFLYNLSFAQVTLNSANMPTVGDRQSYFVMDHGGSGPGAAGTSMSWDFSAFTAIPDTFRIQFLNPASTPNAATFSTADVCWFDGNGNYRYFKNNAGDFRNQGEVNGTFTLAQPVEYTDAEIYFTFPFAYGTSSADSFSGTFNGFGATAYRWGADSVEADGSGSLNLGDTTYADVIRLSRHVVWTDSTNSFAGIIVNNYDFEIYEWWTSDGVAPVMSYTVRNYTFGGSPTVDTTVHFAFDEVIISNDPSVNPLVGNLNFFPNPSSAQANINFELSNQGNVQLDLIDLNGRLVKRVVEGNYTPGNFQYSLNTEEFTNGIYFLKLTHPEGVLTRKVVLN